ncbi:F-box family protein [Striga asiatica]|uniref:F-box family protein n=1 Tax=Striga asiatica TaxID=4170 RepID=A0A5A7Q0N1_STRAF|nr:F-box family protein [Striga asiatica]
MSSGRGACRFVSKPPPCRRMKADSRDESTMVRYRPKYDSITRAPKSGSNKPVPDHTFMLAAADAVDCLSGPVSMTCKYKNTIRLFKLYPNMIASSPNGISLRAGPHDPPFLELYHLRRREL